MTSLKDNLQPSESKTSRTGYVDVLLRPKLIVKSIPKHSTVSVDGNEEGFSPIKICELEIGSHEICLTYPYYKSHTEKMNLVDGMNDVVIEINLSLLDGLLGYADNSLIKNVMSGVIYDSDQDVEWLVGPDKDMTFDDSTDWINSLGDDWRMPSKSELSYLSDLDYKIAWQNWGPFENSGWWAWADDETDKENAFSVPFLYSLRNWFGSRNNSNMTRAFAIRNKYLKDIPGSEKSISSKVWVNESGRSNCLPASITAKDHSCLVISTNPPQSDVYINGEFKGKSPISISSSKDKRLQLKVIRKPFNTWFEDIFFCPGDDTVNLLVELELPEGYSKHERNRFIKHVQTGLVEDTETGYMWLPHSTYMEICYKDALDWVASIGNGWSLPTAKEVSTLKESKVLVRHSEVFNLHDTNIWTTDTADESGNIKVYRISWKYCSEGSENMHSSDDMTALAIKH